MKILYKGNWVELRENDGMEYLYATWCKGVGVAVLAFQKDENGQTVFLGRYENNRAQNTKEPELCSITGGYDNSDKFTIEECAINELEEEGGYRAVVNNLINIGLCMPSKTSDTIIHLFAIDIDISKPQKVEATGDGGQGEKGAYCNWITKKQAIGCKDPLFAIMIARMELKTIWD